MSHYSSGHAVGGHYSSGHYGITVARVYTTDADRVVTLQNERVIRAKLDNRIILADNIERLIVMPGVEVVEINEQDRVVSIALDDRIVLINDICRITEAD